MSSVAARTYLTPEEYIALERKATLKSEYLSGEIVAMSGASLDTHNHITMNTVQCNSITNQLEDRGCRIFTNDMRVGISAGISYFYPDVVVVPVINPASRMTFLIHSSIHRLLLKCFLIQPQAMTEVRNSYAIGN